VLRGYVAARLREDWSPEQIAGVLKNKHPAGSRMRVSHETIYKSLFIQSRGVLAKELQRHLRSRRPIRRSVHNTVTGQCRSQIIDAVSISQRPAEAADRAIRGHWEMAGGSGTYNQRLVVELVEAAAGDRDVAPPARSRGRPEAAGLQDALASLPDGSVLPATAVATAGLSGPQRIQDPTGPC
jgi:hypothetical protein